MFRLSGRGGGGTTCDAEARTLHHAWRCAPPSHPLPSIPLWMCPLLLLAAEACRFIFPGRRILAVDAEGSGCRMEEAGAGRSEVLGLGGGGGFWGSIKDERIRRRGLARRRSFFFCLVACLWIGHDGVSGSGLAGRPQGGDGRRFHKLRHSLQWLGHVSLGSGGLGRLPGFLGDRGVVGFF